MILVAIGLIGYVIWRFVEAIQAARQFDPSKAGGLDGALQTLAQQPYGKFLLALAALGLIAYGIYMLVQARYRQIKTS